MSRRYVLEHPVEDPDEEEDDDFDEDDEGDDDDDEDDDDEEDVETWQCSTRGCSSKAPSLLDFRL